MILVDTNVILRTANQGDPQKAAASEALKRIEASGEMIAIVPQCCFELWVVATRPKENNGLGMSIENAQLLLQYYQQMGQFLPDPPQIMQVWQDLIVRYRTVGKPAHDARIVAAMQLHGIESILTFNTNDFSRYGVKVVDPRSA